MWWCASARVFKVLLLLLLPLAGRLGLVDHDTVDVTNLHRQASVRQPYGRTGVRQTYGRTGVRNRMSWRLQGLCMSRISV